MSKTLLDACSDLSGVLAVLAKVNKGALCLQTFAKKHKLPVNLAAPEVLPG